MRAYLQLLRLPNVFTAMADILLGYLFTNDTLAPWYHFALLLTASSLIYLAGMVLNDYFDQEQDARERPFRPIPSGRVSARTAALLGIVLLTLGVIAAWCAAAIAGDVQPGIVALLLAGAVLSYDSGLKRTPTGPLVMGWCRTLNVLLGMSLPIGHWQPVNWVVAIGVGIYITGVTLFARTEARQSNRPQLAAGVVVLLAGLVLLASLPYWVNGYEIPEIMVPDRWYLFWGLFGLLLGYRTLRAVIDPSPELVQAAVKNCIFSLIIVDAAACMAVQPASWGLVILSLLVPTIVLGRWIYST